MNVAGTWSDGCIHDVSDQGLLLSSVNPPPTGTYVDIRRGTLVIIGRVVWNGGSRFGVRTQDPVSLAALRNEPVLKQRPGMSDRRKPRPGASTRTPAETADRSKRLSSSFQFVCLTIIGLGIACAAAAYCYQTLASPVNAAAATLNHAVS
ncbi:hypothetical protein [Sphingomonas faeni]|uniref:hypothetical protein n=1 Tax=Sphingomonas faeni TaxID=185950 RepID=UPI00336274CF